MIGRALVLAAGLGTRLQPLTRVRAKAAAPVDGEPLARRTIRWLAGHGIRDLVVNLHHKPESIAAVVGDGRDLGVRIRYSWESPVLGSAGGPRHALPLLLDALEPGVPGTFVLVNGDTLTDVDLPAMIAEHHRTGALVTMALIPNPRPDKYGGVGVSEDGWVTGFTRPGSPGESFHFIGVQFAEPGPFADLEDGVPSESVRTLYPRLMAANPRSIAAFVSSASFRDIGAPADCLQTSVELAGIEGNRLTLGQRTAIADSARLTRTAVWDDVTIGADVALTECIIGDGVSIPAGAHYERCAIVPADRRIAAEGERVEGALLIKPL
jgi:NDP-sugar pyrophosphorylase family protein